jgi:hypothetical protein
MHKVLIAAQVVGWSTIALLMGSCNSNSNSTATAQNLTARENPVAIDKSQPDPVVASSPVQALTPAHAQAPKVSVAKSPDLVSVPYVNPLNSIPLLAQQQVADDSAAQHQTRLKSSSAEKPDPQINTGNDGNIRVEQVNNISAIPKLVKPTRGKHQTHTPILSSASCQAFPCLILSQDPSNPKNRFNNPIYKLTAYRDKTLNYTFQLDAVTGRGFTQARNRYQSNTEAPLPDGSYAVAARVAAGNISEVGGTMVPIFPKPGFNRRMRRTALGIHWDPSFDRDKKEDGTSGCIGLTNKDDYHRVRDFILKYHPRSLEVQITQ